MGRARSGRREDRQSRAHEVGVENQDDVDRLAFDESVLYTWATVLCSLLLWPLANTTPFYVVAAVVLGAGFLWEAHRLLARVNAGLTGVALRPMRFFHLSNAYLALLFLAVAVDSLL